MVEDEQVSRYLDLSREYLAAAKSAATEGNLAPARFNSTHALELALKAAIAARTGLVPKLHNVGGEFGRVFGSALAAATKRRINRLLDDYNAPRYPDWVPPTLDSLVADVEFIEIVVFNEVPRLLQEDRR